MERSRKKSNAHYEKRYGVIDKRRRCSTILVVVLSSVSKVSMVAFAEASQTLKCWQAFLVCILRLYGYI